MSARQPKSPRPRPADENRRRRLQVIADLDAMMQTHSLDREFTGNIEIMIPAKDGRIGEAQFTVKRFGRPPV